MKQSVLALTIRHLRWRSVAIWVLLAGTGSVFGGSVLAQQQTSREPEVDAMIEALKPRAMRSARNFQVTPASASEPSSPAVAPPNSGPIVQGGSTQSGNSFRDASKPAAGASAPRVSTAPPSSLSLAILFDFDSARIRPESQRALTHLASAMMSPELVSNRFLIEGHTDARGGDAYNLRLSHSRAREVQKSLVARGVEASRLSSIGKGSSAPAEPENPLAAANRCVRVVNLE